MDGRWITCDGCDAPYVMGFFDAVSPQQAEVDICGLGFFELYLNGEKVSEDVLTPVWTDYTPRPRRRLLYPLQDTMRHRVCFRRWPLALRHGRNTLGVLLGNGWYNQRERNVEGDLWYGDAPCLWFRVRWQENGAERTFVSGPQLTFCRSPIVRNSVYFGEDQDLRLPLPEEGAETHPVSLCEGPQGALELQSCPSDQVVRRFAPRLLSQSQDKALYDAGHTLTGWAALTVGGSAGQTVTVRYAETLNEHGQLDFASCGGDGQIQQDRYISRGVPLRCRPHFTWHGFRYLEVCGPAENVEIQEVHAAVAVTGAFSCSSPVLNRLADAYVRTRLNNLHCGVPSDCPHRERLGYTGDGQATAMTDMYLLDGDRFYRKWIQDILDCQDPVTGHVQHTAPFYGGGGGPGGWGGAVVLVPWAHYVRYGDLSLLQHAFPAMEKWVEYMFARMDERGAVVREEEKGWCLGDWCAPEPIVLPEAFVNTCYLARCLLIMEHMAVLLGKAPSALSARREKVQKSIQSIWWDGTHFAQGVQGADALALEAGLGGEALARTLDAHYREQPWFDTGFLATGSVIRQLFRFGYGDTALALLLNRKPMHSFVWQQEQGADTLWERWDGLESRDHPMFGGVVESLFRGLAGIDLQSPSVLRPVFPAALNSLSCRAHTRLGPVSISWRREKDDILLTTDLPAAGMLLVGGRSLPLPPGEAETRLHSLKK